MDRVKIIILAAGKGVRMESPDPKALVKVGGKAMIRHLLHSIEKSGIDPRPVIVVGYEKEKIISELGEKYDFVVQTEQLGTGHAVLSTQEFLKDKTDHVMVLPSDHPFVSPETIKKLADTHLTSGAKITMATIKLPDFEDWRAAFYKSFSRIIRNDEGKVVRDVQFKDANEEEKKITEVNPIYFCFEAVWLWEKIKTLKTDNVQKEYYLTDLVRLAIDQGEKIESIDIAPREGLAANSKEELEILEKFVVK